MTTDLATLPLRNLKNMHAHAEKQLTHWRTETATALSALLLANENKEHWENEIKAQEAELIERGEFEALVTDEPEDSDDENLEEESFVHVEGIKSDNPPF